MEFQQLIKQRASLKSRLTTFEKYVDKLGTEYNEKKMIDNRKVTELELKIQRMENVFTEFEKVQNSVEISEEGGEEEFVERNSFESRFDASLAIAKTILSEVREIEITQYDSDQGSRKSGKASKSKNSSKTNSENSEKSISKKSVVISENSNQSWGNNLNNEMKLKSQSKPSSEIAKTNVELPRIKLPVFAGMFEKWPEFRDTFVSLVHNRGDLDEIEKYHYLRLHLDGEAKTIIESVSLSANNYKIAWQLMNDTYDNKNLLVYNHLKQLVSIPQMNISNSSGLRSLSNQISKHLNSLSELGVPTDHWDVLIIFLMCEKLDSKSEQAWEEYNKTNVLPTLNDFKKFLKAKADTLEKIENRKRSSIKNVGDSKSHPIRKSFAMFQTKCIFCNGEHYITNCSNFLKNAVNKRVEFCKAKKLCLNCLKPNHLSKNCKSSSCRKCNARHHTLLHFERNETITGERSFESQKKPPSAVKNETKNSESSLISHEESNSSNPVSNNSFECYFSQTKNVLLSTALVIMKDNHGKYHNVRVLLDSGSQSNFISEEVCKKFGLKKIPVEMAVVGVTQVVSKISYKCEVHIKSVHNDFQKTMSCLVIPKISDQIPSYQVNVQSLEIPKHLKLADPQFYSPGTIDLLIGAELFYSLLCVGQISLGQQNPIMQKTLLGWVVSGPIGSISLQKTSCNVSSVDIQRQLEKFWQLEESADIQPILSKDEEACEIMFNNTTVRDHEGRFTVHLPLRENPEVLGRSKQIAMKRFFALENKLQHNPVLKSMYHDFMEEYKRLGHMSILNEFDESHVYYFLPHHGILNENSLTTKLRVVFDASCPTQNGISLNDILLVGPTIQDELFSIILRFRQHRIVVCADVEKMYRMIGVNSKYWPLQCIFWRSNPDEDLCVYNLTTVTYGTSSAPYLAVRCLEQLAQENRDKFPKAATAISHDFYVDDFISGTNSPKEAIVLCEEVSSILKSGAFNLRKWCSNNAEVMASINQSDVSSVKWKIGETSNSKTLGLFWSAEKDYLTYSVKSSEFRNISKRSILSEVSQIFDPLGLLSPCVVIAKIMLQRLWSLKLNWDEAVPIQIANQWRDFNSQLQEINSIEIPRGVVCDSAIDIQLHGFSDASHKAYGACVYVRSKNSQGQVSLSLLCAKSKVAPIKTQTVNRLELCGALVLAQLMKKVKSSLTCQISKTFLWSDSTVVLCWVKTSPHRLQQFVANRIASIQTLTNLEDWHHVSTHHNPADLTSRGINPRQIKTSNLWWSGPEWLSLPESEWPMCNSYSLDEIPEVKHMTESFYVIQANWFQFNRFSNFIKLKHSFAYVLRFINNCKNPSTRVKGPLITRELKESILWLTKIAQQESFSNEMLCFKKNKLIHSSKIQNLNPFLDDNGILRVGGRIQLSEFSYEKQHPMLLSGKHHFSKLLLAHEHKSLLHAGAQHILSSIRERFWITAGKSLAKRVVHECIRCYRMKPQLINPIMGLLPKDRLTISPPFHITGVDYAGPILIRDRKGRGSKLHKCYISVFVCFSTKALHLELVTDLSSEAFLATFRRFVSRRGKPSIVYSDNGTTFVGAKSELERFSNFVEENEASIKNALSDEGITWNFIPAYSPHFGGLWEAGVKSTKFHLKRVLGNAHLTFENLYTVLVQIEATLNSRPITPMSSDPSDLDVLTPAHFLIGRRLTSIPDGDYSDLPINRMSQYQYMQKLQQSFWVRWSKDYIGELQVRTKWTKNHGELKPGTLVILKDDHLPPMKWRLGRIHSTLPGPDGITRVATIMTSTGLIKRSFSRLCPLPSSDFQPLMEDQKSSRRETC